MRSDQPLPSPNQTACSPTCRGSSRQAQSGRVLLYYVRKGGPGESFVLKLSPQAPMSIPECLTLHRILTSLGLSLLGSKRGVNAFIIPLFHRAVKRRSETTLKKTLKTYKFHTALRDHGAASSWSQDWPPPPSLP